MTEENCKIEEKTEKIGVNNNSEEKKESQDKMPTFNYSNYETELTNLCKELYNVPCDKPIANSSHHLQQLFPIVLQHEDLQSCKDEVLASCLFMTVITLRNTKEKDIMNDNLTDDDDDDNLIKKSKCKNITITDLLQATNVNVRSLFKTMNIIKENYELSESVSNHLLQLEKKYCIMSALFYTFERICEKVFRIENGVEHELVLENHMPPIPDTEGVVYRKKLIWTLFLHAKRSLMSDDQELVKSVHLLLCCVEYVLRLSPSFLLNSPYDTIRIGCSPEHQTNGLIEKLADNFDSCIDEVQLLQRTQTENYFTHLPNVDDLEKLTENYLDDYRHDGDLNDLLFLTDLKSLPKPHTPKENGEDTKEIKNIPMTPVRAALSTVQQVKNLLTSSTDEPSEKLQQYFNNCSQNPTEDIKNRLREQKEVFIDQFCGASNLNQGEIASQRYQLAVRLYYRVIESMLDSEHERLSETDFSRLLNNVSFHQSLLACSIEVVLVTYGVSWNPATGAMGCEDSVFSFPWILNVFKLQAYDFFKVLESFIKAEPKLTGELIRHLQNVENSILESEAWKKGSVLYDIIYRSDLAPVDVTSPSKQPVVSPTSADLFLSPMKTRSGIIPPSSVRVTSPSNVSAVPSDKPPPHRSQSLNLFFNKVCRLGYNRLQKLCDMLRVPKELTHRVWTCFEHCITQRPSLMENRHIDQIMMCSIYAICKVVEKEIRFKTIVERYKNLPHSKQEVFKNAYIEREEYDSIIGFYNKVFMEAMKQFILQFSNNRNTTPSLSPVPRSVTSPIAGSQKYRVPGRNNFYVSPLKESPFKAPSSPSQMTPRSRQLYCFGDERVGSAENLRSINERVSGYHNQRQANIPRGLRRLKFDQPDEDTPPAKVPRITITSETDIVKIPSSTAESLTESSIQNGVTSNEQDS